MWVMLRSTHFSVASVIDTLTFAKDYIRCHRWHFGQYNRNTKLLSTPPTNIPSFLPYNVYSSQVMLYSICLFLLFITFSHYLFQSKGLFSICSLFSMSPAQPYKWILTFIHYHTIIIFLVNNKPLGWPRPPQTAEIPAAHPQLNLLV